MNCLRYRAIYMCKGEVKGGGIKSGNESDCVTPAHQINI